MKHTIADIQGIVLKEKIRQFFTHTVDIRSQTFCPVRDLLSASLDKWSLFIIYNLGYNQTMRFSQLKGRIDGISSRMLSVTLKKLETNNVLTRKVYPEVPPRVEYQLTEFGKGFAERLIELSQWYIDNYPEKIPGTLNQDSK